ARAVGQARVIDTAVLEQAVFDMLVRRHHRLDVLEVVEALTIGDLVQCAHGDQVGLGRDHRTVLRQDHRRHVPGYNRHYFSIPEPPMEIVAGLTLKNLRPRVWDPLSPDHVPGLTAVMLSFDEFRHRPKLLRDAMSAGLSSVLFGGRGNVTPRLKIFLD